MTYLSTNNGQIIKLLSQYSPEMLAAGVLTGYSRLKCRLLLLEKTTENDSSVSVRQFQNSLNLHLKSQVPKTVSEHVIISEGNDKP